MYLACFFTLGNIQIFDKTDIELLKRFPLGNPLDINLKLLIEGCVIVLYGF